MGVIVGVLCDSHRFYTHITDLHTFSYLVPFRAFQLVIFVGLSLYLFEVRHNPAKDEWGTCVSCVAPARAGVITKLKSKCKTLELLDIHQVAGARQGDTPHKLMLEICKCMAHGRAAKKWMD